MMETIEYFTDYLQKIGTPNFLAIGITLIVIWLLISGLKKGLKRRNRDKESEKNGNGD